MSKLMEQFQLLDETLLTSDFTFGFELECIYNGDEVEDTGEDDDETDESSDNLHNVKVLMDNYFIGRNPSQKYFGKSHTHQDCSVHGDGYSVEYSSNIFPCTPYWFDRIIKALEEMIGSGDFETNESCGFHHHLHFNNMTERDIIWIYCNMASDVNFYNTFKEYEGYDLYNDDYASFQSMEELNDAINEEDYDKILPLLSTEKFRAFRIHPQGTLEWRGPRNFMNEGNVDYIKGFYVLFNKLIYYIKGYMDRDELAGTSITKTEFFDGLTNAVKNAPYKPDMEFLYHNEGYDRRTPINFKSKRNEFMKNATADQLTNYFSQHNDVFAKQVVSNINKLKSYLHNICVREPDKIYDILLSADISEDLKKRAIEKLIQFVDDFYIDDQRDKIYRESKLYKFNNEVAKKLLDGPNSVDSFKELLYTVLSDSSINMSLGEIERGLKRLSSSYSPIQDIFSIVLEPKILAKLGNNNAIRILFWLAKSLKNSRRYAYVSDNISTDNIKNFIIQNGKQEEWDNIMLNLMQQNSNWFKFVTDSMSSDKLAKLYARYRNIKDSLSDEQKEKISSLL